MANEDNVKLIRRKKDLLKEELSPKQCRICGAVAINHNFGVLSCESCKAFFRRNANNKMLLLTDKCRKNCVITKETRTDCKICRLQRCFREGMDKALILSEEQLSQRRRKIRENKKCRPKNMPKSADAATAALRDGKCLTFQDAFIQSCTDDSSDDRLHQRIRNRLKMHCSSRLHSKEGPSRSSDIISKDTLSGMPHTGHFSHSPIEVSEAICDTMTTEDISNITMLETEDDVDIEEIDNNLSEEPNSFQPDQASTSNNYCSVPTSSHNQMPTLCGESIERHDTRQRSSEIPISHAGSNEMISDVAVSNFTYSKTEYENTKHDIKDMMCLNTKSTVSVNPYIYRMWSSTTVPASVFQETATSDFKLPFAVCFTDEIMNILNPEYTPLLEQLKIACSNALDKPLVGKFFEHPNLEEWCDQTEGIVPVYVSFAKCLEGFMQVPENEQCELLKSSFIMFLGLYFLPRFDVETNTFNMTLWADDFKSTVPGKSSPTLLTNPSNYKDIYEFAVSRFKCDSFIIVLVMCFFLFSSNTELLERHDGLVYWSQLYLQVLFQYISKKYPNGEIETSDVNNFILKVKEAEKLVMGIIESVDLASLKPMAREMYEK